ncbi:hypothetical protein DL95DRAFT_460686 [Leptodontidium sp. 2 PMI_412]|nr:hypothetical protein DL95DRAFT_460686 [Leptodontidium sp. 2 PMI_412]
MANVLGQLVHSVDLLGDSPSLSRIAFQAKLRYDIFDDMHEIAPLKTFLSAAETYKIEEIIFVFGIDSVCQSPDVVLISPTKTPKDLLPLSQIEAMSMDWKLIGTHGLTWEMMEKYDRKLLEDLKNEYILRKEEMTRAGVESGDFEEDSWVGNPSTWTIKKITYIQAVSASVAQIAAGI